MHAAASAISSPSDVQVMYLVYVYDERLALPCAFAGQDKVVRVYDEATGKQVQASCFACSNQLSL